MVSASVVSGDKDFEGIHDVMMVLGKTDNSSICTGNRDWSGELDRVDKVVDAVGDRERGAGVEQKGS